MAVCADSWFQKQTQKDAWEQLMSHWSDSVFGYGRENGYPFQPGSQRRKSNGTYLRDDQTSCCSAFLLKNGTNYGDFGQGIKVSSWTKNNQPES